MLAMEVHSTQKRDILDRVKTRKANANINAGTWGSHTIDAAELSDEVKDMGKGLRFSGLSDVRDVSGTSIGEEFRAALNNLGLKVQGDPTFKGTLGTFKVMDGSRETTISIPFAAQDAASESWISKKGDAEFITHLRTTPTLNKDGKLVHTVTGHNEALLDMLRSPEKIAHQAMSDKDMLKDLGRLTNGKMKDIEVLKRAIHDGAATTVLANVSQSQLLKRALKTDWLAKQNWVTATADLHKAAQSGHVAVNQYAMGLLDKQMPGARSSAIGVDAASQDLDSIKYKGATYSTMYSYPQEIAEELKAGNASRIQLPYKGKMITSANLHEVDNVTTRNQFRKILEGGLGFTLASTQTSEYTMEIRESGIIKQTEGAKSQKGLLYLDENIGARSINGVKTENLAKFRHTPTILDREMLKDVPRTGHEKAMSGIFKGEKKGVMNMFGLINPVGKEEYLGIAEEIYSGMKAFQPVQWSVSKLANGGLEDRSMVSIDYVDKAGKRIQTEKRLSEIFTDKVLRDELIESRKMNIKIGRNNILGLNTSGGEVWNNESLSSILGKDGQNVYSKGEALHMNKNDFLHTLRDNASMVTLANGKTVPRDPNAPMKFYGQIEGQTTKAAFLQSKGRGVIFGRIENEAKGLAHAAGIVPNIEMYAHKDMFAKILPQTANGQSFIQKGSPEMLQFMQESLAGHLMAYNNEAVSLKGDIASRFNKYLGKSPGTKSVNLTKELLKGDMQWSQSLGSKEALGAQIADTAAVLGAMKEHTFKAGGALKLDDTLDLKIGASQMADAWNRATSSGAEDIFTKLHNGEAVSKEAARAHAWGMVSGIVPQEIGAMTQGTGFNTMKIGFKDTHFFLDKTGILEEFAYQNTTNSTKMMSEIDLMAKSLGGDEQFKPALKAYEEHIGEKIKR
ncbi:MAG: hypothetical protein PHY48_17485, partial [Candidatus Cloacimonetes bacterium]|nr:hypothetical protein [Candidatus Cloacimonadota bacterium]